MPYEPKKRLIMLVGIVMLIGACANVSGKDGSAMELKITWLEDGLLAERFGTEPGAVWIDNRDDLLTRMNQVRGSAKIGKEQSVPAIDFSIDCVLLVWMGEKPTSGYGLTLMTDNAYTRDRNAFIPVKWEQPEKGALLPQMVTNPYLLVRVPIGDYHRIMVVDQNGCHRVTLKLLEKP